MRSENRRRFLFLFPKESAPHLSPQPPFTILAGDGKPTFVGTLLRKMRSENRRRFLFLFPKESAPHLSPQPWFIILAGDGKPTFVGILLRKMRSENRRRFLFLFPKESAPLVPPQRKLRRDKWSGRRESDPQPRLGKPIFYH